MDWRAYLNSVVLMELGTPRGMRDFLPASMVSRERVFSLIKQAYERHGFLPMETPALESRDVLTAKCGDEVSKQLFRIEDSELALRFDLTIPFARVVAGNTSLPKPFKRYCISRVWRREEPQKGRYREFWQADADVVGSASMRCEAELLAAAAEALSSLGFSGATIRLNDRKLLDAAIASAGVPEEKRFAVFRSLDKLEKIGEAGVRGELGEKGIPKKQADFILAFGEIAGDNGKKLAAAEKLLAKSASAPAAAEGIAELKQILSFYSLYAVSKRVPIEVDFSLVRGLDYYSGPVYEIGYAQGGVGTISAGGRYDALIGMYGGAQQPAAGISLGIERILYIMEQKSEFKESSGSSARVFVAPIKPEFYPYAVSVLEALRAKGVNAEIDIMERNLRKQFEYANAMKIPFVAIIGEKEQKEGKVTIRNLSDGTETLVAAEEAAAALAG